VMVLVALAVFGYLLKWRPKRRLAHSDPAGVE